MSYGRYLRDIIESAQLTEAVDELHSKLRSLGYKKDSAESTPGEKKTWWRHPSGVHPASVEELASKLGHKVKPGLWQDDKDTHTTYHPETGAHTTHQGKGLLYLGQPKKNRAGAQAHKDYAQGRDPSARYESYELDESHMSELHATISDHMDKHIASYKKMGGAEALMGHADTAAKNVAKMHNIPDHHAKKFVNDYIDSKLTEETSSELSENISSAVMLKMLKKQLTDGGYEHTHSSLAGKHSGIYFSHPKTKKQAVIRWGKIHHLSDHDSDIKD